MSRLRVTWAIGCTAAVLVAGGWLSLRPFANESSQSTAAAPSAPLHFPVPDATPPSPPPAPPSPAPADVPSRAIPFDSTPLFSRFQLALGSTDPAVIEEGLRAWRTCAGFVGFGASDTESWLNLVIPEGLTPDERDRRARWARASSVRCAGFAGQADSAAQAEWLSQRAQQLGLASERLRNAVLVAQPESRDRTEIARLSCAVISQDSVNQPGIRLIASAMMDASSARPSHVLNSASSQARNVAINLAFCDLDSPGCDAHSNFVGSACLQAGDCSYAREVDYWRSRTPPHVFAEAQPLRATLVGLIRQKACDQLFR